jgi:alpha-tubulin suppressor-like RCC1 family protein
MHIILALPRLRPRGIRPTALLLIGLAACGEGPADLPTLVASVTVTPDTATILAGDSLQLSAAVHSSAGETLTNRLVEWSSSDSAVVKVSSTGMVTAIGPTTATVTATSEGVSGAAVITVQALAPVPAITGLVPDSVVEGHGAFTLVVRGTGFTQTSVVSWNESRREASFVSETELHLPVAAIDVATAGTVEISVENPAPGGGMATRVLTITARPSLRILVDSLLLTVGDTAWVEAQALDASGQPVWTPQITWERVAGEAIGFGLSADSLRGRVRGQGLGRFRLVARTDAGLADTVIVRILPIQQHLVSVAAGNNTSCGLDSEGRGYCWGLGYFDGPGDGEAYAPAPLAGDVRFRIVVPGHQHGCGLTLDGRAYCWGLNDHGELGTGGPHHGTGWVPVAVASERTYSVIATYGWHTCALTSAGELDCWGANTYGQIGDGTLADRRTPATAEAAVPFVAVSVGGYHTCALDAEGRAYCWGANSYGQLGRGTETLFEALPAPVAFDLRFAVIAVGGSHTCGLTHDGAAHCWGGNYYGQLGHGSSASHSLLPVAVAGGHAFTSMAATWHTCGRTTGGEIYCWGQNDSGENGVEPTESETCVWQDWVYACLRSPVRLPGTLAFPALSVGGWHTCGMSADGVPFCWGEDHFGQLGVGMPIPVGYSARPLQVHDGRTFPSAAGPPVW